MTDLQLSALKLWALYSVRDEYEPEIVYPAILMPRYKGAWALTVDLRAFAPLALRISVEAGNISASMWDGVLEVFLAEPAEYLPVAYQLRWTSERHHEDLHLERDVYNWYHNPLLRLASVQLGNGE